MYKAYIRVTESTLDFAGWNKYLCLSYFGVRYMEWNVASVTPDQGLHDRALAPGLFVFIPEQHISPGG